MNTISLRDKVEELVANSKYKEALEILSDYTKQHDLDTRDLVLLTQASFNRHDNEHKKGVLSRDNYNVAMARVGGNITDVLKELPKDAVIIVEEVPVEPVATVIETAREIVPDAIPAAGVRKILFMKANPQDTVPLNLDGELRKVKDALESSTLRDKFELITEEAVQIHTITKALQKHKPDIVHFSGHGTGAEGLAVEDASGNVEMFPTEGLDRLFKLFKKTTQCVVLNACYASEQAKVISEHGVYVTGMNNTVKDKAAGDFSLGFYQSLFEGEDFEFAFQIAIVNISGNLSDANTPEMWLDGKIISA
jgi:hypothetical protein